MVSLATQSSNPSKFHVLHTLFLQKDYLANHILVEDLITIELLLMDLVTIFVFVMFCTSRGLKVYQRNLRNGTDGRLGIGHGKESFA